MWNSLALGLQYTARTYNTFCVTVLSYLWQVAALPEQLLETEEQILRQLTPGPGSQRVTDDLYFMKETFGLPLSFQSIRVASWAAKLRTLFNEGLINKQWDSQERLHEMSCGA